jgi:hypothetical protein
LYVHWGLTNYAYPTPRQRDLAKGWSEDGLTLSLGTTHTYVKAMSFSAVIWFFIAWAIAYLEIIIEKGKKLVSRREILQGFY